MQAPDDRRRASLHVTLGLLRLPPRESELQLLHSWLDTWNGIGLIAVGMHRQGLRLSLSQIADGEWCCYFMRDNTLLAPRGCGVAPTPWQAVQVAAWAGVGQDAVRE